MARTRNAQCGHAVSKDDCFCPTCGNAIEPADQEADSAERQLACRYFRVAQIAALLGFGLPWMAVSCSQQPIARLSGFNLAFGSVTVRDPVSGTLSTHTGTPVLAVSVALLLLVIGLFSSMLFARKRAADFDFFYSASALALISYTTWLADPSSMLRGNYLEVLVAGSIKVENMSGLWITCLALCASVFLSAKVSSVSDNSTPPSRLRRALGILAVIAIIAVPFVRGRSNASANPGTSQSSNPSATEHVSLAVTERGEPERIRPAGLELQELQTSDTEGMVGATCWATNSENKAVFASDGTAVIRVGGLRVKLAEIGGRIGGNTLHALDQTITVVFEDRPGKEIYFEEGVSKPMTMTVLDGDGKRSIPVMRSCGA